jgi:hypothetical protein
MKKFAYIACWKNPIDAFPHFTHTLINAEDETQAYTIGYVAVDKPDEAILINDYAFELPEENK